MDTLKSSDGSELHLAESMAVVALEVRRNGRTMHIALAPDEAEEIGYALIRSAMIAREQKHEPTPEHVRCKSIVGTSHWPFTTRCTLYLDEHQGKKCIDKHGQTWVSTAKE